jgi:hypothetical protein
MLEECLFFSGGFTPPKKGTQSYTSYTLRRISPGQCRFLSLLWGTPARRDPFGVDSSLCEGRLGRCLELYGQLRYLLCMVELSPDVAVFAAVCDATGMWSVLAPVAHELSGRHGIRRVWAAPGRLLDRTDTGCRLPIVRGLSLVRD